MEIEEAQIAVDVEAEVALTVNYLMAVSLLRSILHDHFGIGLNWHSKFKCVALLFVLIRIWKFIDELAHVATECICVFD